MVEAPMSRTAYMGSVSFVGVKVLTPEGDCAVRDVICTA